MNRSLLLAAAVSVGVLLAALWLYPRLFGDGTTHSPDAGVTRPVTPARTPDAGPSSPGVDAGTATNDAGARPGADAGAAAPGGADAGPADPSGRRPDAGPHTKAPVSVPDQGAKVIAVSGFAETRRGQGRWTKLKKGQVLDARDSVRTGRNGEARLQVGDGVEVRVSPRSEFSIREITEGLSRVRLEVGHVSASIDEKGNRVLRVEAAGSDAVAESSGGSFGMVSDGLGQVAVATTKGQVKLKAKGQTQIVGEGEQSVVMKNAAPSAPTPVPKSLLLKVADPVRRKTNATVTYVEGHTSPGSVVRVDGKITTVTKAGKFRVPVRLKDGENRINVAVTDSLGRTKQERMPSIVVDREKPTIDAEVKWGSP